MSDSIPNPPFNPQGPGPTPPPAQNAEMPQVVPPPRPPSAPRKPPYVPKTRVGRWLYGVFSPVIALVRLVLRIATVLLVALVVFLGLCALLSLNATFPGQADPSYVPKGYIAGAYHVHSTASDGRGSAWDIAQAAKKAGLSFVILTDHNLTEPPAPHYEDGVLLIHGTELSTAQGHLVRLGGWRPLTPGELHGKSLQKVVELGGIGFIAHPVQSKMPWTDWNGAGAAAGLELYSSDTMLREAQHAPFSRLLPALGAYPVNPTYALMSLVHEQEDTSRRLMEISAFSPKVALCAEDAHGIPSYEAEFKVMAHFLPVKEGGLPEDAREAAKWVLQSLSHGEGFCVFRPLGGGAGEFSIDGLDGPRRAKVGSKLRVLLPPADALETRLKVTGFGTIEADGRTVRPTKAGPLLIEVWRQAPGLMGPDWRPWIVPSPILVHD